MLNIVILRYKNRDFEPKSIFFSIKNSCLRIPKSFDLFFVLGHGISSWYSESKKTNSFNS